MSTIRHRLTADHGSVLIAGLLLSVALLMLIGAAVDIGNAFIVRRQLVALANQAALTGSQALNLTALHDGELALDPQQAQTDALQTLAGQPGIQATAEATPTEVRVQLHEQLPTILLRLVGLDQLNLAATATASPQEP